MTPDAFTQAQLAEFAWIHGKQNASSGMIAVAFVIRNRVRAGWYGGDWLQVIANAWRVDADTSIVESALPDPREPAFRKLLQMIEGIFDGSEDDKMTNGALYFAELNHVSASWFKENILAKGYEHLPPVALVGTMSLFK